MLAIAPLIGTAIENASELHSVINVRLGVNERLCNVGQLAYDGDLISKELREIIETEMIDNVRSVKREFGKIKDRQRKKEKALDEVSR